MSARKRKAHETQIVSASGESPKADEDRGMMQAQEADAPRDEKMATCQERTVMDFCGKLLESVSDTGRTTLTKRLLESVTRQDLLDAGRLAPNTAEGQRMPMDHAGDDGRTAPLTAEVSAANHAAASRREPRRTWQQVVRMSSVLKGQRQQGRAGNLSTLGVFIETTQLMEVGDPLGDLRLPSTASFR